MMIVAWMYKELRMVPCTQKFWLLMLFKFQMTKVVFSH